MGAPTQGHYTPRSITIGPVRTQEASILGARLRLGLVAKGVAVRHIVLLVTLLVLISSGMCLADQLQWNSLTICERAVRIIDEARIILSYCPLADKAHIEVWWVGGVDIVRTPAEGLYEVVVTGIRLCESRSPRVSGGHCELVCGIGLEVVRESHWFAEGIDLAYVYLPASEGGFRCLGTILELPCVVEVETIHLAAMRFRG